MLSVVVIWYRKLETGAKRGAEDSTEALGRAELTWLTSFLILSVGYSVHMFLFSSRHFLSFTTFLDVIFDNFSYSFLPTFPNPFFTAFCDPFFISPSLPSFWGPQTGSCSEQVPVLRGWSRLYLIPPWCSKFLSMFIDRIDWNFETWDIVRPFRCLSCALQGHKVTIGNGFQASPPLQTLSKTATAYRVYIFWSSSRAPPEQGPIISSPLRHPPICLPPTQRVKSLQRLASPPPELSTRIFAALSPPSNPTSKLPFELAYRI